MIKSLRCAAVLSFLIILLLDINANAQAPQPTNYPKTLLAREWNNGYEIICEILVISNLQQVLPVPPLSISDYKSQNAGQIPNAVFLPDNRFKVTPTKLFPFSAVTKVKYKDINNLSFSCTGWMIGPRAVATAAHCIYDKDNFEYFKDFEVISALDASISVPRPYGTCSVGSKSDLHVPATYPALVTEDFGVIILDCNVGYLTGWLGFRVANPPDNTNVVVTGYQAGKPVDEMWAAIGDTKGVSAIFPILYYDADTQGGSSGGPVWTVDQAGSAIAINAADPFSFNME